MSIVAKTAGWIKMPLGTEVGLVPVHTVLDKGTASNFRPVSVVAKTAGWIKMPLGTDIGLRAVHIVLDGDPDPPKRGKVSQFLAYVNCEQTVAHGTWYASTQAALHVRWGTTTPKRNSPHFRPMCIVAKRSPIPAAAEHLYYTKYKRLPKR